MKRSPHGPRLPLYIFCSLLFFVTVVRMVVPMAVSHAEPSDPASNPAPAVSGQTGSSWMEGMVFVKGGCFDMGDTFGDGDPDEVPAHQVCVDDFYMGMYEVTQRQWLQVMGTRPSSLINCNDCPVENVSFKDVQEFLRKLNRTTGGKYRLPTEAEWEYAAKNGGKRQKWAGADRENEVWNYAWLKGNSNGKPQPVGRKKPNGLGLYDMCGNVHEWVNDYYTTDYYRASPKNNPEGPSGSQYRAARGGSFLNSPWGARTSIRYRFTQDDRGREFGFRLAAPAK